MAARVLTKRVMYMPNLRAAVNHFRSFSWHRDGESADTYKVVGDTDTENFTVWPDQKLGPFGAKDKRFLLPGDVGHTIKTPRPVMFNEPQPETVDPNEIFDHLPSERHSNVLTQTLEDLETLEASIIDGSNEAPTADDMLECVAHDCPTIMRKDFADLFPGRNIMYGNFTVITISQKTVEDMTGWSMEVEEEREQLLESFIKGASEICEALHNAGFWADFIDPSCGKPYLQGEHTNAALYETDERYRKLGFEIDDLGCCKVIRHHLWGSHSYIGCIFTNAPATHPVLEIMKIPLSL